MAKKYDDDALIELGLRLERWARRNRILIVLFVAAIAVWALIYAGWSFSENMRLDAANRAFSTLLKDENNSEARAELSAKSSELYELFLLSNAAKNGDLQTLKELGAKNSIAADLAAYQFAALSGESDALSAYEMRETRLLKEFSLLQEAYLLLQNGQIDEARGALSKIEITSELRSAADSLEHFGALKK